MKRADTIDDVIAILRAFIEESIEKKDRMGYFASLYLRVTLAVKEGIVNGRFQDAKRMEHLDVVFANYFLKQLETPKGVWCEVFKQSQRKGLIMLQHLLLGMNAHINFDLALALFETQKERGEAITLMKEDFFEIDAILIEQIDTIQELIAKSWWVYRVVDLLFLRFDEKYVAFSIKAARRFAWVHALEYACGAKKRVLTDEMDKTVKKYQEKIVKPKGMYRLFVFLNYLFEPKRVARNIKMLAPKF